ncbi:30S ribosomal protein S6 [Mycoplasmopsis ciconiae]|uniref:Small ribosomal subunit protein bS6 n=1 Tax=Mycoplasmopsis ciconiae TaxID=561067 RepID=A0ABU7MKI8_9BACT|nr:30S ribosomal protein S6 [Mycoplasmopsis ciconiae]
MAKYEIMMIVDPKADVSLATNLLTEVFGEGVKKAEKLELNELAFEINKSKHAQYVLAEVEAASNTIAEFTRKTNIIKGIWRKMVINLDSEKGFSKSSKRTARKSKKETTKKPLRTKEAQVSK